MKVSHETADLPTVGGRPWLIGILMIVLALVFAFAGMAILASGQVFGGLLMLLVVVGVPVLIAALMVQRVRLTFDGSAGQVTRARRSVLGLTRETCPLDRLVEARIEASTDSDGTTHRMALRFRKPLDRLPFTTCNSSGNRPGQMAVAVNAWLTRAGQGTEA